jgi:hypothetical protein
LNGGQVAQAISEWLLHRGHVRANSPAAFVVAVACVAVSTLLRLVFGLLLGADITPFATYYPAILIAAIAGGAGAGVLTLLLGGLAAWWTFIPPYFSLQISSQAHLVSLVLYLVAGAVIVWLSEAYRGAVRRVRDEEAGRLLFMRELQHRNSNTLAVVQAIASDALRHDPASADAIVRRLGAYVRTNDLLTRSDSQTLDLRAVLAGELEPYGTERVVLDGPPLQLSAEITSTLALAACKSFGPSATVRRSKAHSRVASAPNWSSACCAASAER